jgi:hypothetical protein
MPQMLLQNMSTTLPQINPSFIVSCTGKKVQKMVQNINQRPKKEHSFRLIYFAPHNPPPKKGIHLILPISPFPLLAKCLISASHSQLITSILGPH